MKFAMDGSGVIDTGAERVVRPGEHRHHPHEGGPALEGHGAERDGHGPGHEGHDSGHGSLHDGPVPDRDLGVDGVGASPGQEDGAEEPDGSGGAGSEAVDDGPVDGAGETVPAQTGATGSVHGPADVPGGAGAVGADGLGEHHEPDPAGADGEVPLPVEAPADGVPSFGASAPVSDAGRPTDGTAGGLDRNQPDGSGRTAGVLDRDGGPSAGISGPAGSSSYAVTGGVAAVGGAAVASGGSLPADGSPGPGVVDAPGAEPPGAASAAPGVPVSAGLGAPGAQAPTGRRGGAALVRVVPVSRFRGQGWRLDPDAIVGLLTDVSTETETVGGRAQALANMFPIPGVPNVTSMEAIGGQTYHNRAEWGHPWDAAAVAALDVVLTAMAGRVGKVACVLAAATTGVYEALVTYDTASGEMAGTMITEAARAGDSGDFSFFQNL